MCTLNEVLAKKNNNKINIAIDEAVEIEADSEKIKSIVLNLLENAIKYSGENKEIKIALKRSLLYYVNIMVSDNGHGINENDIPHIFERFYRSVKFVLQLMATALDYLL